MSEMDNEGRAAADGPVCLDDPRPWIPPGSYSATGASTLQYRHPVFKRQILVVEFRIFGSDYNGIVVPSFYRPTGGRMSRFYREWTVANGGQPPKRRERMPPRKFLHKLFAVEVQTVKRAWDGGSAVKYSRVSRVTELLTSNEPVQ